MKALPRDAQQILDARLQQLRVHFADPLKQEVSEKLKVYYQQGFDVWRYAQALNAVEIWARHKAHSHIHPGTLGG